MSKSIISFLWAPMLKAMLRSELPWARGGGESSIRLGWGGESSMRLTSLREQSMKGHTNNFYCAMIGERGLTTDGALDVDGHFSLICPSPGLETMLTVVVYMPVLISAKNYSTISDVYNVL